MTSPRYIIVKLLKFKIKEKILKAGRGKLIYYVQENNSKNDAWLLMRNNGLHKTMEQHI